MKQLSKKDKYFLDMLDAERKYRAATSGNNADEPFVTPVLFSLLDSLDFFGFGFFFILGALVTLVATKL